MFERELKIQGMGLHQFTTSRSINPDLTTSEVVRAWLRDEITEEQYAAHIELDVARQLHALNIIALNEAGYLDNEDYEGDEGDELYTDEALESSPKQDGIVTRFLAAVGRILGK